LELTFDNGIPVALDGKRYSPYDLLAKLNKLGGDNGVGRVDIVESRYLGMKSRGVYETPGGAVLIAAHRDIEGLTLDGSLIQLKDTLMPRFAQLVYNGYWFSAEMGCILALLEESQKFVTGKVRLSLYKGNISVLGRSSEYSLYDHRVASMDDDHGAYDPGHAGGFIRLHAMPLLAHARRKR
jgi:argininosuccinate synthase